MVHCPVEIGHILNDQRVVAPHFQSQNLLRLAPELLVQQVAHGGAAGEEQAVNQGMAGQALAGIATALDQVDHSVRHPGFLPQPDRHLRDPGGQLTGFEHYGVAGQQRRYDMAVRQMAGEVVGAKHRHHAVGSVPQHRLATRHLRFRVAGALVVGLDGNADLADHGRHFRARLPQRLAGFQANLVRQGFLVGLQLIPERFHHSLPLGKAAPAPRQKRLAGLPHRRIHIFQAGAGPLPNNVAGHRLQ